MSDSALGLRPDQTLLFIGGLHRSGTTALTHAIAGHPDASGFSDTPAHEFEDEGQHLQDVYADDRVHGGAGRFALNPESHLTESSPLATDDAAARLWKAWSPYWDLERRLLVEKSPPNLVMTRFLLRLFPRSVFLMIMRHPVVNTLSTMKWADDTPTERVMANWFAAHDRFLEDAPHLPRVKLITYEALTRHPEETLAWVGTWLGLDGQVPADGLRADRSAAYEERWRELSRPTHPQHQVSYRSMQELYSERALEYGYSLTDLTYEGGAPPVG